jgi:hypothetical protein
MSQFSEPLDRELTDEMVWGKPRCEATTASGECCRCSAQLGADYCSTHLDFTTLNDEEPREKKTPIRLDRSDV